jgi:hypothetical protein
VLEREAAEQRRRRREDLDVALREREGEIAREFREGRS